MCMTREEFSDRLSRDWRGVFAELRAKCPVYDALDAIVVTHSADVVEVLSHPETFWTPYAAQMDPSVGPYMLGRDNSILNERDKRVMRSVLKREDLPAIRAFAGRTAAAALASRPAPNSLDIVATVSRLVPLRVVQNCFGFPGPDDATMLRWAAATQRGMFYNAKFDPAIHRANVTAGQEMQQWIRSFLAGRKPWATAAGEDSVSRLIRLTATGESGLDPQGLVSNICGLLVGAIEPTSMAIANATEQILLRPEIAVKAARAAAVADRATLDALVWEALRFNPMTLMIPRVAGGPATLARGTIHATEIPAGRSILAAVASAMFDESAVEQPEEFRPRPRGAYLHMGHGPHECLGNLVGYEIIPETVRHILLLPGIHLLPGEAGKIDKRGGPFAESFRVGLNLNELSINQLVNSTAPRPHPLSLWSPSAGDGPVNYVSWTGLTDRSYTGRHLPAADEQSIAGLPDTARVLETLFARRRVNGAEEMARSGRTSALFCFFAQWFTDSFLQTDPTDQRKNTSNHEIDLCQIYGLNAATSTLLRTHAGGTLRTEGDEAFPEHLYGGDTIRPHFLGLPYVAGDQQRFEATLRRLLRAAVDDSGRRNALYATGLDRGNTTIFYTAISTIFIREHNRICRQLQAAHPGWDDHRLFEIARNINIVLLLRIIIEEYINHLAARPGLRFSLQRDFAERQAWYRTNRIALEFNLLYRWHSLVPNHLTIAGYQVSADDFRFNNAILERHGAETIIDQASQQLAGRIGLGNSPDFLMEPERKTLDMGRRFRLQPYNRYRERFGMPPVRSYDELTGDPELSGKLRALYGDDVNRVELVVGLLAERRPAAAVLPGLMGIMVGVDAFSQALTNPLLSANVYGESAFSEVGLQILDGTTSFREIVERNTAPGRTTGHVSFDVAQRPETCL
jgi:cytochrome P450